MENTERELLSDSIETDTLREQVTTECTVEHTLPDYMPEIRRIRRIDARVIPSGKYVGDGGVEFSGIVAYTVIYTDGEGKLAAAAINGDYSFTCPERAAISSAFADTEVENTACRLGGPRKLSLRSTLKSRVHLCVPMPLAMPEIEGCKRLLRPVSVRRTLCAESGEISIYDGIAIPGILPDEVHPLFCDGSLEPGDCRAGDDSVKLTGRANIRVVALTEDGRPMGFTVSIPVEREMTLEGAEIGDVCLVTGRPTTLTVRPSGDGEGGTRLEIDGAVECEVRIAKNREIAPVVGLYSPEFRTETVCRRLAFESVAGTGSASYTVSGSYTSPGDERAASVLDTVATATVRKITEEEGRPVVLGDVRVGHLLSGTASGEETEVPCFSAEYVYPFRIEAPFLVPVGSDVRYECHTSVVRSTGRITEDGLADDTELRVLLTAYTTEQLPIVESAVGYPEEVYKKDPSLVRVVYPGEGDTLWSLAERYHTTVEALAMTNRLALDDGVAVDAPESLDGVAFLLVE